MRITILGRGRLGRSLRAAWSASGHAVCLAAGRSEQPPEADVIVLTVPDAAVAEVARRVPVGPPVLHCAGALDLDVLAPHPERGSLHPLMTFPGPEVHLPALTGVPAAIAGTPGALAVARALARDLGLATFEVPGDRRLYHAAAVLAGNLPLVLATEAAALLREAGVAPDVADHILLPLAGRAVENARFGLAALTGPIARADRATLAAHLDAFDEHGLTQARALYRALVKHTLDRLGLDAAEFDDPR